MGRLIYTMLTSLDGYVEDPAGNFDWATPDEEVHRFVNELERDVGTHLYGRRMYEVMTAWETLDRVPGLEEHLVDFARIWQGADKIVYSSSLAEASTARTQIERRFDPDAIRSRLAGAEHDMSIGGPELAAAAFRAGLVDVVNLFLAPVIVGGGKRALPADVRVSLQLKSSRTFANGMVYVAYRVGPEVGTVGTLASQPRHAGG
jgi:dihydrofolate reductase